MIKLDVQPYCHDCMDFDPDVEYPAKYFSDDMEVVRTDTIVRCDNRKRCENLRRYLEKQIKGE